MQMTEKELYSKLKRAISGFYTRIENTISSGIPDVLIVINGKTVLLELKVLRSGRIKFLSSQIVWATHFYNNYGIHYYCLVGSGEDIYRLYNMRDILTLKRIGFVNFFLITLDNCKPIAIGFNEINSYFGN